VRPLVVNEQAKNHIHLGVPQAHQDFFALWKDTDVDIPVLIQAKQEYEKL
jgi:hypothetical protein